VDYEAVLQKEPDNRDARIGRFYALAEQEDFRGAFAVANALAASEPPTHKLPEQSGPVRNDDWLDDQILAAQARSFADMPGAAWRSLEPLVRGAPADANLRSIRGEFAAARDWPRLSDEEIHIAASLEPENRSIQIALAESAMRRERWTEARAEVARLAELYPGDPAVQRVIREVRTQDTFELETEFRYRAEKENTTGSDSAPGPGNDIVTRLRTAPLFDHLRFIAAWEEHSADVSEGLAQRFRTGAGAELTLADFSARVMGWDNYGSIAHYGGDAGFTWQPTDHWSLGAEASYFSAETPLRAVLHQITANSVSASLAYTWNEARSLRLSGEGLDFSDGNRRRSLGLTLNQKLIDIPHFDLTLRPELYSSKNSSNTGPYFSPLQDFSGNLTLDAEHVIWRHYERSYGQRLALSAGGYWEKGYGASWIGNILYEQVFKYDPWVEVRAGLQLNRAVYDGERTPSLESYLRITLRF
jgi:biofilm PGA synthesis protein PgaA